ADLLPMAARHCESAAPHGALSSLPTHLFVEAVLPWRNHAGRRSTCITGGGSHVPCPGGRIDGGFERGQYIRIISRHSPVGAGSQLACLSFPGDSFWKYRVSDPSGLNTGLSRRLTVNLFSGLGLNHHPPSMRYMVIDQKPSTGGVCPFANVTV